MDDLGMSWLAWLISVIAAVAIPVGVILLVVGLLTYAQRDAERRSGRPPPDDGPDDDGPGTDGEKDGGTDGDVRHGRGDEGPEPEAGGEEAGPDDEGDGGGGDDDAGRGPT